MRAPFGERRSKTLPARLGSLDTRTLSIQPLDERGFENDDDDEEAESSKPKSLQMRVGKVREKNQRDWSGERWWRKDKVEEQAAAIWGGDEAERMTAARSWDLDRESMV